MSGIKCNNYDIFEIGEIIGEGAFGEVYRAKEKKTGKTYAIKKIKRKSNNK